MIEGFDWDDVRVFLQTRRLGSIAAASTALGLSQATVGRRIRRLEAAAGAAVFERRANRLVATALGDDLAVAAEAMRAGADAFARRAAAARPGLVRVSATASVSMFLTLHIADLAAAAADAVVSIEPSRAASNLSQQEAEIAIRMRRVPADGPLLTRRLGTIRFAPYIARTLFPGGPASPGGSRPDWSGSPVIGLPESRRSPSQATWLDAFAATNGARVAFRLGDVALRHRACADGLGMTLLPCFLGDDDERLVRAAPPPATLDEEMHLLVHDDVRGAPKVRAVAEAIVATFSSRAAELAGETSRRGANGDPVLAGGLSPSPAGCGG